MWVKICANTSFPDALLAAEHGANAVGFVFAPSKRQVTPEQVAEITHRLPPALERIGVFGPAHAAAEMLAIAARSGLTGIQLHRPYSADLVQALRPDGHIPLQLIQVVSIQVPSTQALPSRILSSRILSSQVLSSWVLPDPGVSIQFDGRGSETAPESLHEQLARPLSDPRLDAILLDAAHGGASGGLGQPFAWDSVAPVLRQALEHVREMHRSAGTRLPRIFLAGGLRPENVAEAIRILDPDGVDVASGVEAEPGRKDPERVRAFVRTARAAAS